MQFIKISSVVLALTFLAVVTVEGGQRGQSGKSGPSTHGNTSGATAARGSSPVKHGPPSSAKANGSGKAPKTTASTSAASSPAATTASPTTTSTTGTTATAINFTSGPVAEKLTRNTNLSSKVQTRLQSAGYAGTVYQAAYGFKNLGQFVAAVNVSQNLGVSFEQLKLQMTGLKVAPTGTVTKSDQATKSLGQAIQAVKPGVDAADAASTATTQANSEIAGTAPTPAQL